MDSKRPTPRHIIKMAKFKDKENVKSSKRKTVTYKEDPIRLSADFSTETFQARREWHKIFKVIKSKDLQPRVLYPARLSFNIEEKNQGNLKEFITAKLVLQEMLKGFP